MAKGSKGKKIALGFGIFLVLSIFIGFFSYQLGQTLAAQICSGDYCYVNSNSATNIFSISAAILGLLAIAIGVFIKKNQAISGGLIAGGITGLIMAITRYWNYLNGWGRVITTGIVLAGLITLSYYKLKD